jgi:YbbR domain-containing protein
MRFTGFQEMWKGGPERTTLARPRAFGTSRVTVGQRFAGVLSPESLFRLGLAFVLATALWLYVNSRNAPDASFTLQQPIQVSALNIGNKLTIRSMIPPIQVQLRSSALGSTILPSEFAASVDLAGLGTGVHRVPVHLSSDPTVPVVGYSPRSVVVALRRVVRETVPVQLHIAAAPPYGVALATKGLVAYPSTVTVTGAKDFVQQVTTAAVFVDLSSRRGTFSARYPVTLENGQGNPVKAPVTATPGTVKVRVVLQKLASFKLLPIVPTIAGEPAPGFGVISIQTNPPGLTAYGSPRALGSIQNLSTDPIRVNGYRAGKKTLWAHLRVPSGVYAGRNHVHVTVTVGPVVGAASTAIPVHHIHLAAGLSATITPATVLVTMVGPSPVLGQEIGKVRALVDLGGLRPGAYHLRPRVLGTQHISVDSVTPPRVTVSIR